MHKKLQVFLKQLRKSQLESMITKSNLEMLSLNQGVVYFKKHK